jgi:hypothetical protein
MRPLAVLLASCAVVTPLVEYAMGLDMRVAIAFDAVGLGAVYRHSVVLGAMLEAVVCPLAVVHG